MIISNVSEESCDIVFSCWNHLPPPFKWCKCNNSKGTGLVVLKFGVYIDRERAMSWVTFQGPWWKVKVTASEKVMILVSLGWGLLIQFSPFRYFPHFPLLSIQTLAIEYHVYIWQVSPQLSCDDTCQIWMWFRESNRYFCKIENFAYGEISERSFGNPHPRLYRGYLLPVMGSTSQFSLESKHCHDPNFVIAAGHDASFFITGTTFWSLMALQVVVMTTCSASGSSDPEALQVVIITTCSAISDQKLASWKLSVSSAWYILYIWCFNSRQLYQEYVPSLLVFFFFFKGICLLVLIMNLRSYHHL